MEMHRLKVYIVEDMAISRAGLEAMLLKNNYEIMGSAAKAETAWEDIHVLAIDIILPDAIRFVPIYQSPEKKIIIFFFWLWLWIYLLLCIWLCQ